jgi:hypothetical membrane protein
MQLNSRLVATGFIGTVVVAAGAIGTSTTESSIRLLLLLSGALVASVVFPEGIHTYVHVKPGFYYALVLGGSVAFWWFVLFAVSRRAQSSKE